MKTIGKWLYILGILVAGIAGLLGFSASWLTVILVLVGVLAAIFYVDSSDIVNIGIRYLLLAAAHGALDAFPAVGSYLTGLFGGVLAFLGPVVLTALLVYFIRKYFLGKK